MKVKAETLRKFSIDNNVENLIGGQNESIKVGQLVVKPVHDIKEYIWVANTLNNLNFPDLNISKPILSLNGKYVEDGFGASLYFKNIGHVYDATIVLKLCRRLNKALENVLQPTDLFVALDNPWKKAQYLAWHGKNDVSLPTEIHHLINRREEINLPKQLVHTDLAGNILINELGETCIIDFTPGFFPKEYAEAIAIVDLITWYHASIKILDNMEVEKFIAYQLILRALVFRMSVSLFVDSPKNTINCYNKDLKRFGKIYDFLKRV